MEIKQYFYESGDVKKVFIENNEQIMQDAIDLLIHCLHSGSKVLIAGNGGSAADSQHRAAELMGRYKLERNPLPAIALTTDTSNLTAVGNDYGFNEVFARQIAGLGNQGDIFICISTSGNSENIVKALAVCKMKGIKTIALLGKGGGKIKDMVDIALIVPSDNTPRIQECHQTIYHTICEEVEITLTKSGM